MFPFLGIFYKFVSKVFSMEQKYCSNCKAPVIGKFCSQCGQATSTQRITPKHFVLHEFLHGIYNLDNKLIFTLKELFTRPGLAARDYLEGKRVRYYNIFYLLLLTLGFLFLINQVVIQYLPTDMLEKADKEVVEFTSFFRNYYKLVVVSQIPFYALNGWLLYRRLKYNFAEHIVLAAFALTGYQIISLVVGLLQMLLLTLGVGYVLSFAIMGVFWMVALLYPIWVYAEICVPKYSILSFAWRFLVSAFLSTIEFAVIFVLIYVLFFSGLV
jgi:hypothetical protein